MFERLTGWFGARPAPSTPSFALPDGMRVAAVGDIHGEIRLLRALLDQIETEFRALPGLANHIVFLGDYVDRGPDSRGTIEFLSKYAPADATCHFLKGNHEDAFNTFLAGNEEDFVGWLKFGGRETLASYEISERAIAMGGPFLRAELKIKLPEHHRSFLHSLLSYVELGDFWFVHAGIKPGVPIDRQDGRDLMWIRREFLEFQGRHPKMIVHGHTISSEVELRHNRIGVDTGAYASGKLSAVLLERAEQKILSTTADDRSGIVQLA